MTGIKRGSEKSRLPWYRSHLKQRKIFNRFARFSSRRSIQNIIDAAEHDYSKVKHDFVSHFFAVPDAPVECKLWSKLSHPNFTYPENAFAAYESKKDIGIAVCGDSLAGACFTLGWLRDYKVWTYADNFELVLKNLVLKPAVSAQFTTGLLCRLTRR